VCSWLHIPTKYLSKMGFCIVYGWYQDFLAIGGRFTSHLVLNSTYGIRITVQLSFLSNNRV